MLGLTWCFSMVEQGSSDSRNDQAQAPRRRIGAGAITGLTGVALLLVFMIQNTEDVSIDFLFWSFNWPLWLYTFVISLIGVFMWIGLGVLRRHRRRRARREARRY
jgi:uncharacterized integral membrane protein